MNFYEANVADILRCHQRDGAAVSDLESQLHSFLKQLGSRTYHKIRKLVPGIANAWYYSMTSLSNLQTLGEEYTGTIRLSEQKISSKLKQTIWLALYIGGEPLLDRLLKSVHNKIKNSSTLTQHAKDVLLRCIQCFTDHNVFLKRIHQSLFYINGKYYYISNRLTDIQYVLLRQWMQDDSFIGSFNLLGKISLFYILFNLIQTVLNQEFNLNNAKASTSLENESTRGCILCAENIKNASATPCGHVFCWECIYDSLTYQKTCPVCREEIMTSRIIYLQNYI